MKHIAGLRDLRPYGFELLTGEACGLNLRTLADVSERGRKLVAKAWGLPADVKLSEPWNSRVGSSPSVGSIMLGPEDYLTLGVFALLESGCRVVYRFYPRTEVFGENTKLRQTVQEMLAWINEASASGSIDGAKIPQALAAASLELRATGSVTAANVLTGIEGHEDDDYLLAYLDIASRDGLTFNMWRYAGTAGDRNVHQFSGRVT